MNVCTNLSNCHRDISLKTTNVNCIVPLEEKSEDHQSRPCWRGNMNVWTEFHGNSSNHCWDTSFCPKWQPMYDLPFLKATLLAWLQSHLLVKQTSTQHFYNIGGSSRSTKIFHLTQKNHFNVHSSTFNHIYQTNIQLSCHQSYIVYTVCVKLS